MSDKTVKSEATGDEEMSYKPITSGKIMMALASMVMGAIMIWYQRTVEVPNALETVILKFAPMLFFGAIPLWLLKGTSLLNPVVRRNKKLRIFAEARVTLERALVELESILSSNEVNNDEMKSRVMEIKQGAEQELKNVDDLRERFEAVWDEKKEQAAIAKELNAVFKKSFTIHTDIHMIKKSNGSKQGK
jgi:hypothetical protein